MHTKNPVVASLLTGLQSQLDLSQEEALSTLLAETLNIPVTELKDKLLAEEDKDISVKEAAELLTVSVQQVRLLAHAEKIEGYYIVGQKIALSKNSVLAYQASRRSNNQLKKKEVA